MGHELLVCHSHLPEGEFTLPLSVHSFSTYLVSTCYNDCWAAQIKNSVVWGFQRGWKEWWRAGPGVWEILESDPGSLQGGISGTGPGRRATQWSQGHRGHRGPFWSNPPALIADTGSRFASTGSCLLGNNTYLWEEQAGGWFHSGALCIMQM